MAAEEAALAAEEAALAAEGAALKREEALLKAETARVAAAKYSRPYPPLGLSTPGPQHPKRTAMGRTRVLTETVPGRV